MSDHHTSGKDWSKVMLGFVVRKCATELGHPPTPGEFAAWANEQKDNGNSYCLFGKAISPSTAKVMLRHLGRTVTVRNASIVKS